MMAQLTEEAKKYLSIIHQSDVLKVLVQMKVVNEQIDGIDEFKNFSKGECEQMVLLIEKYMKCLEEIP